VQPGLQGVDEVTIFLTDRGSVKRVETVFHGRTAGPPFRTASEEAVRNSRFLESCAGRTLTVVFHYELGEKDSYAFGYPNRFYVRAGAQLINPSNSKAAR
jgi:hypothetical protein